MYTALQIMNWLSEYSNQDYKSDPNLDYITPMRVQKLLYYAQCASLALNNKPLFPDSIYKMPSGPKIESVAVFCGRRREIPKLPAARSDFELINKDAYARNLLENIYRIYGFSLAQDLFTQIKSEAPWQVTPMRSEFNLNNLKEFYKNIFEIIE